MILTEEQIKADNERWKGRDIKQELYYLSYAVPNRRSVTNDDLRFNAFVARKALGMIENIQPEQRIDTLKAEIKRMKRSFTTCINSDYYTGYMSALSAVEGYIAKVEGANNDT